VLPDVLEKQVHVGTQGEQRVRSWIRVIVKVLAEWVGGMGWPCHLLSEEYKTDGGLCQGVKVELGSQHQGPESPLVHRREASETCK
jgi:hypothetical protein